MRRVPLAVTTGWNGTGLRSGAIRYLCGGFGVPVQRWRLHVSNHHPRYGHTEGEMELFGISLGPGSDGHFTEEPGQVLDSPVLVSGTGEWVSDWQSWDLSAQQLLEVRFAARQTSGMLAPGWILERDGTWQPSAWVPLWIWIEAEVPETTPVVAVLGDSTGAGQGADLPLYESALGIAGRHVGFLPVFYAHSGDLLGENTRADVPNYLRWAELSRADAVVVQAGSNDLHSGVGLESMQEHFAGVVDVVREYVADRVLACTIKPRFPHSDLFEDVRVAYNTWLLSRPCGIDGVVDTAARIGESRTPVEFAADIGHLTTPGHAAMAEAFVEMGEELWGGRRV